MKKFLIKFSIVFLLGCIFTCVLFIPSFNMDGICTKFYGYQLTSLNFLGAGRLITYIAYILFSIIKLPLDILSLISILFSNIFLAIAVLDINYIINQEKKDSILTLILSFLLIYNPITLELFLFDEAFIMCLGVMFGIKAIKALNSNTKQKFLISIILTSLCTMCYQGVLCIFLPLSFLNIIFRNNHKNIKIEIKNIIKEFFKVLIIYAFALFINFIILKFIVLFISSEKSGSLNIIKNIIYSLRFCLQSLRNMDGYVNIQLYYFQVVIFIIFVIVSYILKKINLKYILYLMFTLILCIVTPFIINLAMNTSENYTAARMYISIGFIVPIIAIYLYKYFNILEIKKLKIIFYIFLGIYYIFTFVTYIDVTTLGLKSYKMDMEYIENIEKEIIKHEKQTGETVNKIYWSYDTDSNFCNDIGICNSYAYRFFAREWSAKSAIGTINKKIKYIEMSDEDKNKYFDKNINYTSYDKDQLVFDKESLYLLIY